MQRRILFQLAAVLAIGACSDQHEPTTESSNPQFASTSGSIGVNVLLKARATAANRTELAKYGTLLDEIPELNVIRIRTKKSQLPAIRELRFVAGASPDAVRHARPIDAVAVSNFANGLSTWDQDAVNVTNLGAGRTIGFDGTGVYVAILDTGFLPTWRQYFPQERIVEEYARSYANDPVVINMSLGGPVLDVVERAAIDAAVAAGVILVASAGNSGPTGAMGFPGAYGPVISVASAGYTGEWVSTSGNNWWFTQNPADPTNPAQYYISAFSALRTGTQDLDVAAPGSWVVGPFQLNQSNRTSFFFLGGTSMASPHVAGIVALMLDKNPTLGVGAAARAATAESILQSTAIQIPDINQQVRPGPGAPLATPPSWTADRSGSGLATANAALAATP